MNKKYLNLLNEKKLTLIMSLPENKAALAKVAWDNGADVVKVHINVEHRASKTIFRSFDEEQEELRKILSVAKGPTGIVLGGDLNSAAKDFTKVVDAGFEFISLYAHHTPIEILESQRIIKMLAADNTYTIEEIENFGKVGADVFEASIIHPETYGQALSVREILSYQCIVEKVKIPVVVPTQRKIHPSQLGVLARCGISGIMIGAVVTGNTEDSIGREVLKFRNAIDNMQVAQV